MGQGKSSCLECFDVPDFIVGIKTGDTKGAGLHNAVYVTFVNEEGEKSREVHLNGCCVTVFKKGRTDEFNVSRLSGFGNIKSIVLQQHEEQGDVDWYVDKVTVRHTHDDANGKVAVFPVNRWMRPNKPLAISAFDSSLPQFDEHPEQRKSELIRKQAAYGYHRVRDLPAQIRMLPREEIYSNFHKFDIKAKKATFLNTNRQLVVEPISWESIEELESLFKEKGKLSRPSCMDEWKSDIHFGEQRIIGCNPRSIQLCKELPENFGADSGELEQFLEGKKFSEAIESKKIFIVNHKILDGFSDIQNNNKIPSPIALFYLNSENHLTPIAIQLYQEKTENNPVFFPTDQEHVWLAAKMWFNCADSAFHRSCLLFAGTHMVLEMVAISVHRHLSPSHPIFRLLGPYLRYVLSINNFEMSFLSAPGGWMDYVTNIGVNGMNELIKRYMSEWRLDLHGCLPKFLEANGVADPETIPDYPYRDDGLLLHEVMEKYVTSIVYGNYDSEEKLQNDYEIQNWAQELVSEDGCSLKGVPGDGKFSNTSQLVETLTSIIFLSTVENAAVNLPTYDECAFIPNYPMALRGAPPNSKDPLSMSYIIDCLPMKHTTAEIIVVNKLVSERETSGMADTRSQFQHDPISVAAKHRFLGSLREAASKINMHNKRRKCGYDYLNPGILPSQST